MSFLKNSKVYLVKSTQLDIHPQALDAYEYYKNSKMQFENDKLSENILEIIATINLPIVIKSKCKKTKLNHYNIFSGWCWIDKYSSSNQTPVIVLSKKLSKKSIRNISWYYVLGILLQSYNRKFVIAHFKDILESLPKKIFEQFDEALSKSTTLEMARFISNENRTPVRTQVSNFKKLL